MPVPQLDVAVVGGGPAGLACAYALTRAFKDIKVQVLAMQTAEGCHVARIAP